MHSKVTLCCVLLTSALSACEAPKHHAKTRSTTDTKVELKRPNSNLPLAQRLELEANSHPEGVRRVNELLEGLARESLFVRTRQVLALPVGADYCSTAISSTGVGVSLCAFPDAESAKAGAARSRQLFDRLIPNRTLLVQESTLLTLSHGQDASAEREAERLAALFPSIVNASTDTQTALKL